MHLKATTALLMLLAWPTASWTQTKISGTMNCAKPDPVHTIVVGDRPDHVFTINKATCTWPKPTEIAGTRPTAAEITTFAEIVGTRARTRGISVVTLATGDKTFSSSQGSGTVKDGKIQSSEITWTYTGGTGKLKGIKGKGTAKVNFAPDGSRTIEVEGEYQLAK